MPVPKSITDSLRRITSLRPFYFYLPSPPPHPLFATLPSPSFSSLPVFMLDNLHDVLNYIPPPFTHLFIFATLVVRRSLPALLLLYLRHRYLGFCLDRLRFFYQAGEIFINVVKSVV